MTLGKKNSTISQYVRAIDDFVGVYTKAKTSIDDVDRQDLLSYIAWMRSNLKHRQGKNNDGKGDPQHAHRNRRQYIAAFLNHFGVKCPLPMKDIKKPVRVRPWKYSDDVINLLLSKANRDQKDLMHFFLNTGFRDEEAASATWMTST